LLTKEDVKATEEKQLMCLMEFVVGSLNALKNAEAICNVSGTTATTPNSSNINSVNSNNVVEASACKKRNSSEIEFILIPSKINFKNIGNSSSSSNSSSNSSSRNLNLNFTKTWKRKKCEKLFYSSQQDKKFFAVVSFFACCFPY
jgi:hypothetical protein